MFSDDPPRLPSSDPVLVVDGPTQHRIFPENALRGLPLGAHVAEGTRLTSSLGFP